MLQASSESSVDTRASSPSNVNRSTERSSLHETIVSYRNTLDAALTKDDAELKTEGTDIVVQDKMEKLRSPDLIPEESGLFDHEAVLDSVKENNMRNITNNSIAVNGIVTKITTDSIDIEKAEEENLNNEKEIPVSDISETKAPAENHTTFETDTCSPAKDCATVANNNHHLCDNETNKSMSCPNHVTTVKDDNNDVMSAIELEKSSVVFNPNESQQNDLCLPETSIVAEKSVVLSHEEPTSKSNPQETLTGELSLTSDRNNVLPDQKETLNDELPSTNDNNTVLPSVSLSAPLDVEIPSEKRNGNTSETSCMSETEGSAKALLDDSSSIIKLRKGGTVEVTKAQVKKAKASKGTASSLTPMKATYRPVSMPVHSRKGGQASSEGYLSAEETGKM